MDLVSDTASPGRKSGGGRKKSAGQARDIQEELLRRVPPHSVEAEVAVLAGLLMRQDLMDSISDILRPEDFYIPAHQIIFRACLELFSARKPVDLPSLGEFLNSRAQLEAIGGLVYLGQIAQAVVSGANAEYYAGLVSGRSTQRKLIEACAGIISKSYDMSLDVDQLLDESEKALFSIARGSSRNDFTASGELLDDVMEKLARLSTSREEVTGVPTGFESLDALTSGLQRSDLIIIAARPSMGKTAFGLSLALNAAIKEHTVAVFSLEMSKEQLMQRMLASRSKVNLSRIRRPRKLTDEDWPSLQQAANVISRAPIYIDDSSALSTLELRTRARRLKAEKNLALIVVDYLQLMRSPRQTDSRELEISDISRSLKALAKELDIPVVALAQLNRKLEDRTDKRPILADLRESGAIEQDADVIMFVHREDVYKYRKPSERPDVGEAEIIIGKQRNGPVGVAELTYLSPYTAFESRAMDYMAPPSENL